MIKKVRLTKEIKDLSEDPIEHKPIENCFVRILRAIGEFLRNFLTQKMKKINNLLF